MLSNYQQQQLSALLDCDYPLEEALHVLVEKDIISNEQANYVYDQMRN